MILSQNVAKQVVALLSKQNVVEKDLNNAFRLLAKWRQILITNTQVSLHGNQVQNGPFKGLKFIPKTSEGCQMPRLTGVYEHELHAIVEELAKKPFDNILNIGCADGFYAVGLAKKISNTPIFAHDTNIDAQKNVVKLQR